MVLLLIIPPTAVPDSLVPTPVTEKVLDELELFVIVMVPLSTELSAGANKTATTWLSPAATVKEVGLTE